jgi:hypothetical protein
MEIKNQINEISKIFTYHEKWVVVEINCLLFLWTFFAL